MNKENAYGKLRDLNKIMKQKIGKRSTSELVRLITLSAKAEKYFRADDKVKLDEAVCALEKELISS